MLNDLDTSIKIIIGVFAVITALYNFIVWLSKEKNKRKSQKPLNIDKLSPLDPVIVNSLFFHQERELSIWRLLGFRRDIKMMDVHVREILEVASPTGTTKTASHPFLAEEIHRQIVEGIDPDKRFIVIEGNAGSGKSTMLKHWALLLAENQRDNHAANACPVPIYFSLRHLKTRGDASEAIRSEDLAGCFLKTIPSLPPETAAIPFMRLDNLRGILPAPTTLDKLLKATISIFSVISRIWPISYLAIPVFNALYAYQEKRRRISPEWIFLCDGLDEMPRQLVEPFITWVHGLPLKICAVIATRPGMAHVTNLPLSRHFTICDFNDDQVLLFIQQWFRSNQDLGNRFLQEIQSNKAIRDITGIPLLLTFLSLKVEISENPIIPKEFTQSVLLSEITEILLEKWEATKRALPVDNKMTQLGMLAFEKLAIAYSYGTAISFEQLEKVAGECISQLGFGIEYKDQFISRIEMGTQVIQGNHESGYFFIHKIFFDFFFSRYIIRTAQAEMRKQ